MAQVGEETEETRKTLADRRIGLTLFLELEHIENELAGSQQPAECVREGEGDALTRLVIELVAIGIGGLLNILKRP